MPDKKKFLLRIDDKIYAALEKWAADDLQKHKCADRISAEGSFKESRTTG
jgi:hypothetical protein